MPNPISNITTPNLIDTGYGKESNLQEPQEEEIELNSKKPLNINISYNKQNIVNDVKNISKMNNPGNNIPKNNNVNSSINTNTVPVTTPPPANNPYINNINRDINQDYYLQKLKNDNNISIQNNPTEKQFYKLSYILDKNAPNDTNLSNWKNMNEVSSREVDAPNRYTCPLMIDSPWSEFKSGDDIPQPYSI
jgi:hypothetical protein